MSGRLVYVIGEPAAGKTTAVDAACRGLRPVDVDRPVAHRAWLTDGGDLAWVTLGRRRARFSGTDTLSFAASPVVAEWFTGRMAPPRVLAEGDRLASGKLWRTLVEAGWSVVVARLVTSDATIAERRAARAAEGHEPDPSWLAGRATKVARLAAEYDAVRIDGDRPVDDVAADVRRLLTG